MNKPSRDETSAIKDIAQPPTEVSFGEALKVWTKIGLLGFGGPAGQIALMHKELVEKRRWISNTRFLHALNYCMLLPGPEAQQLAAYIGWIMHRVKGGVAAGILFVLPGFVVLMGLSILYAGFHKLPAVDAMFFGMKAAVLAVVVEALLRIGKRAIKGRLMLAIAATAFLMIFALRVPFPAIVAAAALFGFVGAKLRPAAFPSPKAQATGDEGGSFVDSLMERGLLAHTVPSAGRAVKVLFLCLILWFGPVVALALCFGRDHIFVQEGILFSKAAVVTFGGAYAVLAYVAGQAVETYKWLFPHEMADGLGLAETTPGPLILVLQFVGFVAAFRNPGSLDPFAAGAIGAAITVWVTFVPSFLWIFLGAPYIEALRGNRLLHAALSTVTAAVVGVVLNLSVWFTFHTAFAEQAPVALGSIVLDLPVLSSVQVPMVVSASAAMVAMLRFKIGVGKVLIGCVALGVLIKLFTG